jgi:hypothetical protein
VGLKPENPVVGGTALRRQAIQSPDFVTGVSGWIIRQDGSAEFNNLTIRGTFAGTNFVINSSGSFFYSPTEAAGNLVESIASVAGVDGFGDNYVAGHASYGAGFATSLQAGFVQFYTGSLAGGWSPGAQLETDSSGDLILVAGGAGSIQLDSPVVFGAGGNTGTPSTNSTSTNGLASPGITGTSGGASAGTAHTHGGGSYVVGSGQHSHDLQNHEHPL